MHKKCKKSSEISTLESRKGLTEGLTEFPQYLTNMTVFKFVSRATQTSHPPYCQKNNKRLAPHGQLCMLHFVKSLFSHSSNKTPKNLATAHQDKHSSIKRHGNPPHSREGNDSKCVTFYRLYCKENKGQKLLLTRTENNTASKWKLREHQGQAERTYPIYILRNEFRCSKLLCRADKCNLYNL